MSRAALAGAIGVEVLSEIVAADVVEVVAGVVVVVGTSGLEAHPTPPPPVVQRLPRPTT